MASPQRINLNWSSGEAWSGGPINHRSRFSTNVLLPDSGSPSTSSTSAPPLSERRRQPVRKLQRRGVPHTRQAHTPGAPKFASRSQLEFLRSHRRLC